MTDTQNNSNMNQTNVTGLNWLHIAGLPFETTEEDIAYLFKEYSIDNLKVFTYTSF